jgi:hypothetical protein
MTEPVTLGNLVNDLVKGSGITFGVLAAFLPLESPSGFPSAAARRVVCVALRVANRVGSLVRATRLQAKVDPRVSVAVLRG